MRQRDKQKKNDMQKNPKKLPKNKLYKTSDPEICSILTF